MRAVQMVVAAALAGSTVVAGPAEASGPSPEETTSVTWPLRVEKKLRATPLASGGTSYYCAVVSMVSFNDLPGWEPVRVDVDFSGTAKSETIGAPPYDDNASIDNIFFPPVGGTHQTQLGDATYSQGGYNSSQEAEAACETLRQTVDNFFGPEARIVYEHTDACKAAITKLLDAKKKAKAAKKRLARAEGAQVAAAQKALKQAKAKLKKAKKAYKKGCGA